MKLFLTLFWSFSFNALHYVCPTYYSYCLSACVSLTRLSCAQRTEKRTFSIIPSAVPDGTGRWAIFKVLSACAVCLAAVCLSRLCLTDGTACPVCQTQTGQADWPFSLSRLSPSCFSETPHNPKSDFCQHYLVYNGTCNTTVFIYWLFINVNVQCIFGRATFSANLGTRSCPKRLGILTLKAVLPIYS